MKKKVDAVAKTQKTKTNAKKTSAPKAKASAAKTAKKGAAKKSVAPKKSAQKSSRKAAPTPKASSKKNAAKPTQKAAAKTAISKKAPAKKAAGKKASGKKAVTTSSSNFGGKIAAVFAATDMAVTLAKKLTQTKKPAATSLPQIAPLHHRVVVRPAPRVEKTAGGLYIPESTEHKPLQGTVVAVGLGKVMKKGAVRPMDVQNGDTVLYAPYAGTDVQLEGEQFLILTEDEILGVLND